MLFVGGEGFCREQTVYGKCGWASVQFFEKGGIQPVNCQLKTQRKRPKTHQQSTAFLRIVVLVTGNLLPATLLRVHTYIRCPATYERWLSKRHETRTTFAHWSLISLRESIFIYARDRSGHRTPKCINRFFIKQKEQNKCEGQSIA
jgi:hypothetical protein